MVFGAVEHSRLLSASSVIARLITAVGKSISGIFLWLSFKFSSQLLQSKIFMNIGYVSVPVRTQQLFTSGNRHNGFVSNLLFIGKCVYVA